MARMASIRGTASSSTATLTIGPSPVLHAACAAAAATISAHAPIGILGVDPLGCLLGASLASAGRDVIVVDAPTLRGSQKDSSCCLDSDARGAGVSSADSKKSPRFSSTFLNTVHKLGLRVVVANSCGDDADASELFCQLGPRQAQRTFTADARKLQNCRTVFVTAPRACVTEVAKLLEAHVGLDVDVVLLHSGVDYAEDLIANGYRIKRSATAKALSNIDFIAGSVCEACVELWSSLRLPVQQEGEEFEGSGRRTTCAKDLSSKQPTLVWYMPEQASRITVAGQGKHGEAASARVLKVLSSTGLPVVLESCTIRRLKDLQLNTILYHRVAEILTAVSKETLAADARTTSSAIDLKPLDCKLWRKALSRLLQEMASLFEVAGVESLAVVGASQFSQRHISRLVRAPRFSFPAVRKLLPPSLGLSCIGLSRGNSSEDVLVDLASAADALAGLAAEHKASVPAFAKLKVALALRRAQTSTAADLFWQRYTIPAALQLRREEQVQLLSALAAEKVGLVVAVPAKQGNSDTSDETSATSSFTCTTASTPLMGPQWPINGSPCTDVFVATHPPIFPSMATVLVGENVRANSKVAEHEANLKTTADSDVVILEAV
eukprot:TRINITY_DN7530_c0_g1_i4.p1 TRINITY_DN7530_c0_g1~~TRINITY_DN7530_c0_g1_i4.p1  ORF type:complete len:618 (+),score=88.06 TRINITY_DN7530_c0_g1_i4:30-1856(+)